MRSEEEEKSMLVELNHEELQELIYIRIRLFADLTRAKYTIDSCNLLIDKLQDLKRLIRKQEEIAPSQGENTNG